MVADHHQPLIRTVPNESATSIDKSSRYPEMVGRLVIPEAKLDEVIRKIEALNVKLDGRGSVTERLGKVDSRLEQIDGRLRNSTTVVALLILIVALSTVLKWRARA